MRKDSFFISAIEAYKNAFKDAKSRHLERQSDADEKLTQLNRFADLTSTNVKKSVLDRIREWYPKPGDPPYDE
jgi:hypothetical protein